jgi:ataxin-10
LKLILSRICLEEPYFPRLFSKLSLVDDSKIGEDIGSGDDLVLSEQAFLLRVVSEILNERLNEINTFPNDFALFVFGIFKRSVGVTNSVSRCESGLPTGSSAIDVLGYSLTILRDICACNSDRGLKKEDSVDAVDVLLSSGLIEQLLCLLGELEPPAIIRKLSNRVRTERERVLIQRSLVITEDLGETLLQSLAIVHMEGKMFKIKSDKRMGFFCSYNSVLPMKTTPS